MPAAATGLQRDVRLIRRRAWVFIPFFILGILAAFFIDRVAGDANAVADMQLETVVNDALLGADRGLRIFEAQSMTSDPEFIQMVKDEAQRPDLDYARYNISLNPISVADGVSRGDMTVSISDPSKSEAEHLRDSWVTVFLREYTEPEGLFRTRFLRAKQQVAVDSEELFQHHLATLREVDELAGLPLDEIVRPLGLNDSLIGHLNREEATLQAQLALVNSGGAPATPGTTAAALEAAITELQVKRAAISDTAFSGETVALIDEVRSLWNQRTGAFERLNNARVTVSASQSSAEVTYTSSGGIGGTLIGRIAVVLGVTLVFGLIAIYLLEWLSQVRRGPQPSES